MRKLFSFAIVFYLLMFQLSASILSTKSLDKLSGLEFKGIVKTSLPSPKFDVCGTCVNFMDQAIDELLNIIVNVGVIGSCGALCSYLPNNVEQGVCNMLCDYVGIEVFIQLLQDADPDPIWICEEISACAINDNAKANITQVSVVPQQGKRGDKFTLFVTVRVLNSIGTGEIGFVIHSPAGSPIGTGYLLEQVKPGIYKYEMAFKAEPTQHHPWPNGRYNITSAVCEGGCGSTHSHSFLLSEVKGTPFLIRG